MRDDAGETERLPSLGLGATVVRPVKGKSEIPGFVWPEVWVAKLSSPESWKRPGKNAIWERNDPGNLVRFPIPRGI